MAWNWQDPDWPNFRYRREMLAERERRFHQQAGVAVGSVRHLAPEGSSRLVVELLSTEAVKSAEIEGEILNRDSVQSSLRRQLGLQSDARRVSPAESGIAEMLVDVYETWDAPLTETMLMRWHRALMRGRTDLRSVGEWRAHEEPMQVVSGPVYEPTVHFEAPPSARVPVEMQRFLDWFNRTDPTMGAIERSGIAHLYFESIHPFEDGNGRIGRALADKVLAQGAGHALVTVLSQRIHQHRSRYYRQLEGANQGLDIEAWLDWFADIVLDAQAHALAWVAFIVEKTKLLDQLKGQLNERQEKALLRVMNEGPQGFAGGLSAGKYASITGATPATAGRDLADLVERGALLRTGQRKGTRYWLAFDPKPESDAQS